MLKTLRSQILFIVMAVMIAAAIVIILLVRKDTMKNVNVLSEHSIENISKFIEASMTDNFNYFLNYKYRYVGRIKNHLKRDIEFILRLNEYKNSEIIDTVKFYTKNKSNESVDFILFDDKQNIVFPASLPTPFKGMKNNTLSKEGVFSVLSKEDNSGLKSIEYSRVVLIKNRTFVLYASYNVKFLKNKIDRKKQELEDDLRKILSMIKIGKGGFSFIYKKNNTTIYPYSINKYKHDCFQDIAGKSRDKLGVVGEYFFHSCGNENFSVITEYYKGFDWYFTVALPVSEVEKPANDLAKKLVIIIVLIISFSVLFLILLISNVAKPIAILSRKMSKVPGHDFTGDDHSELLEGLPVTAHNEAGELAKNFSFMIRELSDSIKRLVETTAANERMESELNVARKIQFDILPQDFSEPKRKGADIYAYLNPARQIGGDLYDFFFIDEDHLCFTVGDVADKGVSAALFMFWTKKMISNCAVKGEARRLSPAEIMEEINEMACKDNASATFITLFIGILNIKNGEMRYANGGHVPPIFVDCGSEPKYRKDKSGPAVGVNPEIRYRDIAAVLRPGGAVFLCTDGVTEAMNEEDKLFGDKRLLDDFSCMKDKSCQEVVDGILYEVRMHAGKAPQSDDIAMLMLRWGIKGKDKENYV